MHTIVFLVEFNEVNQKEQVIVSTSHVNDAEHEPIVDPIQAIIDDHKRHAGYYRMAPARRVLVPHKVSLGDVWADQTHLTINRQQLARPSSRLTSSMQLSDLNQNKRQLRDIESVQLLSSLFIRAIQVHRDHVPLIPSSIPMSTDTFWNFTDALNISPMHLHTFDIQQNNNGQASVRLPLIVSSRPTSAQADRMKFDVNMRATQTRTYTSNDVTNSEANAISY
jgi:hypothetical protein